MKKPLNLKKYADVEENDVTLEISKYPNDFSGYQNLQLSFVLGDNTIIPFTSDSDEPLFPNCAYIDLVNFPWLEQFITESGLGRNLFVKHYIDGHPLSLFCFSENKLKELSPEEFKEYLEYKKNHQAQVLPLSKRLKRERKEHWEASKDKKWHPTEKTNKGNYKTTLNHRINSKRYYNSAENLTAFLSPETYNELVSKGVNVSKLLSNLLLEYLSQSDCEVSDEK